MFVEMSEKLSAAFAAILPEARWATFVSDNAFFFVTAALVLFVFLFLFTAFFMDFMTDVWKLPFAIGVDVLAYLGLGTPILSLAAAALAIFTFGVLADSAFWKWFFGIIAVAAALVPYFSIAPWAVIVAIIPVASVLMFIDIIVD